MSRKIIQDYYNKLDRIKGYSGSRKENQIRRALETLLEELGKARDLQLITDLDYRTDKGKIIYPDGTFKDALRQDWGYWESKDEFDDLDKEIQKKIMEDGYPTNNIIFEDGQTLVLYQRGSEIARCPISNETTFEHLLDAFFSYEPREVQDFHEAIEKFKADLPALLTKLRTLIEDQAQSNNSFVKAREDFLLLCQKSINPNIVLDDIREMIIQHVLTEDIFITVFNDAQFHQENNISKELTRVVETFFKGNIRRNILSTIDPYYRVIKATASNIQNHHEKQRFLKALYETFYRAYNPAAADRLGIIYTPEEIVRFMVDATNHLLEVHFGKLLSDKNVEILDPACGTGTFITEIFEQTPQKQLPYKYENEIHCNEVAILPYYVANLNIEYTYAQKMKKYSEFKHICFVDTLDNLGFTFKGKKYPLPFDISAENLERIKQQNDRTISVIIGNPPYNANQRNENENNKPRPYPMIDSRIKETYIKLSKARKTKQYDMYSRFMRWSSDRLTENGIIAFVLNNSFTKDDSWDGFRKTLEREFNEIYVVDLKGDAYSSGDQRRKEGGNVFSDKIKVGIAIFLLVRKPTAEGCRIYYTCVDDYIKANAKLSYLRENKFQELAFEHIIPSDDGTWLDIPSENWSNVIPIVSEATKTSTTMTDADAIFKQYYNGVSTNRDAWVIDISAVNLRHKMKYFADFYNDYKHSQDAIYDTTIKWSRNLKVRYDRGLTEPFKGSRIIEYLYRPFCKRYLYLSDIFIDEHGIANNFLCDNNVLIAINVGSKTFNVLASKYLVDLHFNGDARCIPLNYIDKANKKTNNLTSYGLASFRKYYSNNKIKVQDIWGYTYAVLHHPAYRSTYEKNLKKENPHIPFYDDFQTWVNWGNDLLKYHIGYESVSPYPFKRVDVQANQDSTILKADKANRKIIIDRTTELNGVPASAFEYKLGNLSAMEWVLEYHKERKSNDPTVQSKFNKYHFKDYKEQIIDLVGRVCTVSIETMRIIDKMPK